MTFSPSGFLRNLLNNLLGFSRFFFKIHIRPTRVPPGKYFLWKHGFAAQGMEMPIALSRSTFSDAKRLTLMGRPVMLSVSKKRFANETDPLEAATYQSPRKVLRFYPAAGYVVQSIRTKNSRQFDIFSTFVKTVPSAALLAESNSRSIRMKLLNGPNLAQLDAEARSGAVKSVLRSLIDLPAADGIDARTWESILRLPRGPAIGRGTETLRTFLNDSSVIDVLTGSRFVSAHTDLNLFNIILDEQGQAQTIDFDFRRIQLLPRWFDALVLTRQCASDLFMEGDLDFELAPFFCDGNRGLDQSTNFIGRHREAVFDFASTLRAPRSDHSRSVLPKSWSEAERRIIYSRQRFLGQNYA